MRFLCSLLTVSCRALRQRHPYSKAVIPSPSHPSLASRDPGCLRDHPIIHTEARYEPEHD